ncbi:MAG: hypothetical protein JWM05_1306 [Acidimicrobiales bacterium]|nr:hypothetical protein [Acidimicrobiales bacterium]
MAPRGAVRKVIAIALAGGLLAAGCTSSGSGKASTDAGLGDPGSCTVVDMAVSSEKIDLMTALAKRFNGSDAAKLGDGCAFVRPQSKASGSAATLLATDWNTDSEGPKPVVWSPAASSWGGILNQRLADAGKAAMVGSAKPFQLTPLVIAMPKPMADALGYPDKPVGWADILRLATDTKGWAAYGHPEWGRFKLGKTNPNFSTSGLNALVGQAYAATGKTRGLSSEDLDAAKTEAFAKGVESSVVHYGDITMTFLNNWFRTDRSGTSLQYASAVAIEEKSVIDYNKGNPDGVLSPGEVPRTPRIPLVAIYPKEGTLYSDSPYYVLDAPWVSAAQKQAARQFGTFVMTPANQRRVLEFGFRPGNPNVAVASPITTANGVDPNQPKTLFEVPRPPVLVKLLDKWSQQRKSARVLLVLDVSGSMAEPADDANPDGPTKLDLAKKASIEALSQFKSTDDVGLRIFSTELGPSRDQEYLDLLPVQQISSNREGLATKIRDQQPVQATPLYSVTQASYEAALKDYDPTRINAIVLLTDGKNDDGNQEDDARQLQQLLDTLHRGSSGEQAKPIRIFPIAYGSSADLDTLKQIAEATNSAAYDARDPASITKVFTAVVSNF